MKNCIVFSESHEFNTTSASKPLASPKSNHHHLSTSRSTVDELIAKIAATPPAIVEAKVSAAIANSPEPPPGEDSDGELKIADDDDGEIDPGEENNRIEPTESAVTPVKS